MVVLGTVQVLVSNLFHYQYTEVSKCTKHNMCILLCRTLVGEEVHTHKLGHQKIGLSQKPVRIGMITARQRIGLPACPKNKK